MNKSFFNFLIICFLVTVSSCRIFNQDRMFETDEERKVDSIQKQIARAEENYKIQKNDYLALQVFSNGGERIIDPDFELSKNQTNQKVQEPPKYLVKMNGKVNFPMIGEVFVDGLTLYQTDSLLNIHYTKYYQGAYVVTKLLNKRVVVLGPIGGKVILMENENMNLIEVIALYGGINMDGKAYNIKLIRGNLKNPDVSIIDLSTIEGMQKASLDMFPNDIVYIESQRRILSESLREIVPLLGLITNILVTIILITRPN